MAAPTWLTAVFAALMLTVAIYCAGRLTAAGRWRRPTELDTDAGHVLMGLAMVGMLVARLRILPAPLPGRGAAVGMAGMTPPAAESRFSFLALIMALFMVGYVVRVADGLTLHAPALAVSSADQHAAGHQPGRDPVGFHYLAPRCAALCKIAMGITMGYMLILML